MSKPDKHEMFHELTNMLEVDTPLGPGMAFLIEGGDHDYYYTVILKNCAIATFRQHQISATRNYSLGWGFTDDQMREIIKKWMERKNEQK